MARQESAIFSVLQKLALVRPVWPVWLAGFLVAAQVPPWAATDDPENSYGFGTSDMQALGDGLYTFRYGYTRNIFIVTSDGVIVTDPISRRAAEQMRDAIREVTDQPVRYVVYSHEHWDHVLGAGVFVDEGAEVVSHAACMPFFERRPHPDLVMPHRTFDGDRHVIELGEHSLELIYLGRNHGDCLVLMRPGGTRKLFIVDLVTVHRAPFGPMPDYHLPEFLDALRAIEAMDFDWMIGGHGPALAPREAVTERREYLEALKAEVRRLLDEGVHWRAVPDAVELDGFAHLGGIDQNLRGNALRIALYYQMGW